MLSAVICAAAGPTRRSSLQLLTLRNNADKPLGWSRLSRKGRCKMAPDPATEKPGTSTRTESFVWGIPQNGLQHKEREVPQDEPPPLPANAELTSIGKSTERYDGPAKVMGKGKYTADINLPGMLYARMVDATIPHGRIVSIDTSAAEKVPGVRAVHVIEHVYGVAELRDPKLETPSRYPMVRYAGQPVAGVADISHHNVHHTAAPVQLHGEPDPV